MGVTQENIVDCFLAYVLRTQSIAKNAALNELDAVNEVFLLTCGAQIVPTDGCSSVCVDSVTSPAVITLSPIMRAIHSVNHQSRY